MFPFRKKRNFWYYAGTIPALILLFVMFGFASRAAFHIYEKERVSNNDLEKIEGEYSDYSARANALEAEIERLKSERGVEEEIRDKFRVVKEGEKMVVIVEPDEAPTTSPRTVERGWWEKFLGFFER